jgi:hypothetical protein
MLEKKNKKKKKKQKQKQKRQETTNKETRQTHGNSPNLITILEDLPFAHSPFANPKFFLLFTILPKRRVVTNPLAWLHILSIISIEHSFEQKIELLLRISGAGRFGN